METEDKKQETVSDEKEKENKKEETVIDTVPRADYDALEKDAKKSFKLRDEQKIKINELLEKEKTLTSELETTKQNLETERAKYAETEKAIREELIIELPDGDLKEIAANLSLMDLRKLVKANKKTVAVDTTKTIVPADKPPSTPKNFDEFVKINQDIFS
jgi:hypothetical protein